MNLDDVKKRFVQEIKLRAFEDRYVDRDEEMEILKTAVADGITVDSARQALRQVCDANDYVVESQLDEKAKEMLEQFAADGQIDKKEFEDTVAVLKKVAKSRLSDPKIAQKVKAIMQANGWQPRQGMFKGGSWYSAI
jgi:hypothetical protein